MADDAPAAAEVAPTTNAPAEPAAQETATAAPAATVTEATPAQPQTLDAKEREWFDANPPEGSEPKTVADEEADAVEPAPPATPPAAQVFTTEQVELLKRFKANPDTMAKLPPQERADLIASLNGHVQYASRAAQELAALKRGQQQQPPAGAGQQQQPSTGQPPAPDAVWGEFGKVYGDDVAADYRSVVQAEIRAMLPDLAPVAGRVDQSYGMLTDLAERLLQDDIDAGLDALDLPAGVDKADEGVRQKIVAAAMEAAGRDPQGFSFKSKSMRQHVRTAAQSLYQDKINQAAAAADARKRQDRANGSASRAAPRPPTTRPPLSQDERDRLGFEGVEKGLKGTDLEAFIQRGGR